MMRWAAALAALLATVLFSAVASAYRPFDFTDAEVARRHRFEIELGPLQYVREGEERSVQAPNLVLNFGLGSGREVALEGANRIPLGSTADEFHTGLDDVAASFKQVLRRGSLQDERGVSLATEAQLLFPGQGESHAGVSSSLIASAVSKPGFAHFNLEWERLPDERDALAGGVILEGGDLEGWAPVMELKLEGIRGVPAEQSVLAGMLYVPREGVEWDMAIRAGRRGEERLFEVRAGLTWQIAAREVIEHAKSLAGHRRHRH